jgi:hypothetical protein
LRPTDVVGAFFLTGLAFLLAGLLAGIVNAAFEPPFGRWLALHLVFVGGISQLILGASQFFAGAYLATDPPSRGLVRMQALGWNLGAVALAVGVSLPSRGLAGVGVVLLLLALALYTSGLMIMRRRSLRRAPCRRPRRPSPGLTSPALSGSSYACTAA